MTKQEFIDKYNKNLLRYRSDIVKEFEHYADDEGIHNIWGGEKCVIPIEVCLKVLEKGKAVSDYIKAIKVGDVIIVDRFGRQEEVTVKKINKGRKLDKKGDKLITSFTVQGKWSTFKLGPRDIIVNGQLAYDVLESYKHCSGRYISFSEYDVKNAYVIAEQQ